MGTLAIRARILVVIGMVLAAYSAHAEATDAPWYVMLEAENAQVEHPAFVDTKQDAQEGQYVCMSDGEAAEWWQISPSPSGARGAIVFSPQVPEEGTYYLWLRVQWHCICSRRLTVTSSGLRVDSPQDDDLTGSILRPRVWRWLRAGSYHFQSGGQTVRFTQDGHQAMIDAIALSRDPDYRPPGFVDTSEVQEMYGKTPERIDAVNGLEKRLLGTHAWADFRMEAAFTVPQAKSGAADAFVGFVFCEQPDNDGYSLLLTRTSDDALDAEILRTEKGKRLTLGRAEGVDGAGPYHSVRLLRAGEDIHVDLDGVSLFDITDSTYDSGDLSFVAQGLDDVKLQGVEIRSIGDYVDVFAGDAAAWQAPSGKWRTVAQDGQAEIGNNYLGTADGVALSVSPWPLGTEYSMETSVQLLGPGAAGLAFDILDEENFNGLVLEVNESEEALSERLSLVNVASGELKRLWSSPARVVTGGQWHWLTLRKLPGAVGFSLDDAPIQWFADGVWSTNGAAGLLLADDGSALFSRVSAREETFRKREQYIFEPETNHRALSHWRQESGISAFAGHPAVLHLRPKAAQGGAAIELGRSMPPNVEIEVTFAQVPKGTQASVLDSNADLPELLLPVLPGDPRVGIDLVREEDGTEYRISTDEANMRDLIIKRDGEVLSHVTANRVKSGQERILRLRANDGALWAGVPGRVETKVALEDNTPGNPSSPWRLRVFAEGLGRNQSASIIRITIRELLPHLPNRHERDATAEVL